MVCWLHARHQLLASSFECMFAYIVRGILRKPALLSHFKSMYCILLQVTHLNLQSYPTIKFLVSILYNHYIHEFY